MCELMTIAAAIVFTPSSNGMSTTLFRLEW